ncbi:MAG TPA: universal stress protein [Thermoanaerobaculia bacterium]|nr:universal stress protein [Thermoanaerobaculia bacterium]
MTSQNSLSPLLRCHRPLRTVLIGTSLGDESDQVVRAGLGIARAAGARVALVHAAPLEPLPIDIGPGLDIERELIARCHEELSRQIERIGIQKLELAGSEVRVGAPYRILAEAAQRIGADLIVVGATGSGPFAAELLGSTADRVLRKAFCPVLVVREGFQVPPRRVLAPVDLSTLSGDAFRCGLDFLSQLEGCGEIRVQAVYASSFMDALAVRHRTGIPLEEVERSAGEELRRFVLENRSEAPFEVETAVLPGEARFEILRELGEHPADLVILGTHGRGGMDRLVLGSVASTVARKAPCSVLVISPEAALAEGIAEAVTARTEPAWHREPATAGR